MSFNAMCGLGSREAVGGSKQTLEGAASQVSRGVRIWGKRKQEPGEDSEQRVDLNRWFRKTAGRGEH